MSEFKVIDGNYACAHISYLFTEVAGIYPITPSSKMPELIEKWAIDGRLNLFDNKVKLKMGIVNKFMNLNFIKDLINIYEI
jgi:pyruvate-ferredoxin/flavodoxin oxidoreductase